MYPWRKILIPTDFSTASAWVFDDAIVAASTTGAEIVILHVRRTEPGNPDRLKFPADHSVYEYVEHQELELLRRYVERANHDLKTTLLVREGPDPAEKIFQAAIDEEIDLIAMATHARHHIAHLFIGSNTVRILSRCSIPILAIRYGIQKGLGMETIVVPVDPRKEFPAMIALVGEIARRQNSEVRLVCCASEQERVRADRRLEEVRARLDGIEVSTAVIDAKSPDKELIRSAEACSANLIVIPPDCDREGTLSGTAESVIRHAPVPVLVVPETST